MKKIAQVTEIPLSNLKTRRFGIRAFRPGAWDVDKRMAWAANRHVTRGEDMAYSLMGVFDVSIITAYGEGQDRAFCRLIEAIMMAGGSPSILNWSGRQASHPASNCLPASPKSYLGSPDIPRANHRLGRRLDLSLTSRGLRVCVTLIPLFWTQAQRHRSTEYGSLLSMTQRRAKIEGLDASFILAPAMCIPDAQEGPQIQVLNIPFRVNSWRQASFTDDVFALGIFPDLDEHEVASSKYVKVPLGFPSLPAFLLRGY